MTDYQEAVQAPSICFSDSELKSGTPVLNNLGLPRPICGQFASVYELQKGSSCWAVKCFLRNIPDLHSRYAKIAAHLEKCGLPYFITFEYLQKGIRVHGKFFPIVKMIGGTVEVGAQSLGAILPGDVECHPVIAPVLIIIGCYMLPVITKIKWEEITEALPAFLTIVVMQFALSISHGIAWGFISYVVLKLLGGKARDIHPIVAVFAVLFVVFLITE